MSSFIIAQEDKGDERREINWSSAARLAAIMLDWWLPDTKTVTSMVDDDHFPAEALIAANEEIPWTLEGYFVWLGNKIPFWKTKPEYITHVRGKPITQEMFDEARDFVRYCALNHLAAYYNS